MPFTEFCCRSGGSNLNSGTRTGSSTEPGTAADFTYASGSWVASTGVFTVASGNPQTDGVAVGDFASVYVDGATVTGFVGRVTARDATTITVSLSAKSGTAPTDGAGTRTLRIGGAWQGPNANSLFPFAFVENTCTNSSSHPVRVNFKNAADFSITNTGSTVSGSQYSHLRYEGYSATYADGGRAVLNWGATVVGNAIIFGTTALPSIVSLRFTSSASSGNGQALQTNAGAYISRCVFDGWRLRGLAFNGLSGLVEESEFYSIGTATSQQFRALSMGSDNIAIRCIVHDCAGNGVDMTGGFLIDCIIESNQGDGIRNTLARPCSIKNCDVYNNALNGLSMTAANATVSIDSTNFTKNGGWAIAVPATPIFGRIANCGFGQGAEANISGNLQTESGFTLINNVDYPSNATPYSSPSDGDFNIALPEAKSSGRGLFVQTQSGYTGTLGYPDIGASQSKGGGSRQVNIRGGADQ